MGKSEFQLSIGQKEKDSCHWSNINREKKTKLN
jgi:hypothetical protein